MIKKIAIIIVVLFIVVLGYKVIFSEKNDLNNQSVEVMRGDVIRKVFETGTIKRGEETELSFSIPGTIQTILFKEGDKVKTGETIATLNNESLQIELAQAEGALRSAEIEFQKLKAGSLEIDLQAARTTVDNAENSLSSAIQALEKAEEMAKERVNSKYEVSIPSLDKAVLAADSANETVNDVCKIHFSGFYTDDARMALAAADRIRWALDEMLRDQRAIDSNDQETIDVALSTAKLKLKTIFNDIDIIRRVLEKIPYRDTSETEFNLLTAEMTAINHSLSSITSIINSINSTKLASEAEILSAEAAVISNRGALQQAKDQLSKIESSARGEDIKLAEIRVTQARSNIELIKNRIEESIIIAPFDGMVLRVNVQPGEFAQAGLPIISVVPDDPYQVELYIYEGDITGINIGDPVDIEIVAFPDMTFKGEVLFIDYASKIIDGVVNFRVLTNIKDYPKEVIFGMTADVTIVPERRDNVLYIPDSAVKSGTVLLIKNGEILEVPVETGLRGFDRNIEIRSGLNEGDNVVISR